MKIYSKKETGITLMALVITIIIIIILATVTINMAFGENGLIREAELARDLTANSLSSTRCFKWLGSNKWSNLLF